MKRLYVPLPNTIVRALILALVALTSAVPATTIAQQRGGIPQLLRLTPDVEGRVSRYLNASRRVALNEMADRLRRNSDAKTVFADWDVLLEGFETLPQREDLQALIRWMLRAAFIESDKEIEAYENQVRLYERAQRDYLRELKRAYAWIEEHSTAGNAPVKPPFLPDHTLQRPKPIMGPKPPAVTRALPTRREVGNYAMGIDRQRARLRQDLQLVTLALEHAQQRQNTLLSKGTQIIDALMQRVPQ